MKFLPILGDISSSVCKARPDTNPVMAASPMKNRTWEDDSIFSALITTRSRYVMDMNMIDCIFFYQSTD